MLPIYIRVPLALEMLLMAVEHCYPTNGILPLGGDHLVQFAILLSLGIATRELVDAYRRRK